MRGPALHFRTVSQPCAISEGISQLYQAAGRSRSLETIPHGAVLMYPFFCPPTLLIIPRPFTQRADGPPCNQPLLHPRPCPPRILIADDNPQNVELLEAYLGDVDYEIADRRRRRGDPARGRGAASPT